MPPSRPRDTRRPLEPRRDGHDPRELKAGGRGTPERPRPWEAGTEPTPPSPHLPGKAGGRRHQREGGPGFARRLLPGGPRGCTSPRAHARSHSHTRAHSRACWPRASRPRAAPSPPAHPPTPPPPHRPPGSHLRGPRPAGRSPSALAAGGALPASLGEGAVSAVETWALPLPSTSGGDSAPSAESPPG